jgi:PAT family beta-lactamase induction signal transducer AmpG
VKLSANHSVFLYLRPQIIVVMVLGFVSGLPLALSASTLSIWLTEAGVDLTAIGLFAAVGTPYSLKFFGRRSLMGCGFPCLADYLAKGVDGLWQHN